MINMNRCFNDLKGSYLFYNIAQKVNAFLAENPGTRLLRMGIGDVTLPLAPAVIGALNEAVEDQSKKESFHGYLSELGWEPLREAVSGYYKDMGVSVPSCDIFISDGASPDLANILRLFSLDNTVLVTEPAYPAYVDTNVMMGRKIAHLPSGKENGFLPLPQKGMQADIIYLCSPANPTGAVYSKEQLKKWVEHANETGSVIIFDAAYEAFISDPALPRSIYEIDGAEDCAIEICSLSKTAGFTGTRLGYTVVPSALTRSQMSLRDMWIRHKTTNTNGVSYIIQKGAAAVFTPEGREQITRNIDYYRKNAGMITDTLDRLGIWYTGGKNSPYVWLECPDKMGSWDFFDLLLTKINVVGTPGAGFGKCGEGYFRLTSFSTNEDTAEAMKRLYEIFR